MLSANCCALLALKNLPRVLIDACQRSSTASGPPAPVAGSQLLVPAVMASMPFGYATVPRAPIDRPYIVTCCHGATVSFTLSAKVGRMSRIQ